MRDIWFIRHGQSEGNIGLKTDDHKKISLTNYGHEQAFIVSEKIIQTPSIIGHSGFLRTYETAQPTIGKFTEVPIIQ